jgi:hypothetical protein
MMRRLLVAAAVLAFTVGASPAPLPADAVDAHEVIVRMLASNPSLASYRARVHVDLRMLNFPFLSPQLDGTTYFKRPDNYEVVFDRVPFYAKGFERIFDDVGDPASWERDNDIVLQGTRDLDGRPALVLYMTKKVYSTILDHAVAYVDPSTYELVRMEWHYRSGGSIVLRQWYRDAGGYNVISEQQVQVDIPHVRAVGTSTYGAYQTNVAVSDTVFTKKP